MMLSRIADSMFWLNRYMERADGIVRSLRYFYILGFDVYEGDTSGYKPLLQCFTALNDSQQEAMKHDAAAVLNYLIADTGNVNSIRVLLGKARENARGSQDKITKEVWEQVNAMYHYINEENISVQLKGEAALKVLDKLEKHCLMYNGIVDSTMPRGLGWEFMNIGKFIERCLHTVDLTESYLQPIGYQLDTQDDLVYWRRLLFALSGYELYLKSNRGSHHTRQAISQVIFNPDFPRSVIYSLVRLEKYLEALLKESEHPGGSQLLKRFGRLKSMVVYTDTTQLQGDELHQLLDGIRKQVWDFSAELSRLFFSYT